MRLTVMFSFQTGRLERLDAWHVGANLTSEVRTYWRGLIATRPDLITAES